MPSDTVISGFDIETSVCIPRSCPQMNQAYNVDRAQIKKTDDSSRTVSASGFCQGQHNLASAHANQKRYPLLLCSFHWELITYLFCYNKILSIMCQNNSDKYRNQLYSVNITSFLRCIIPTYSTIWDRLVS